MTEELPSLIQIRLRGLLHSWDWQGCQLGRPGEAQRESQREEAPGAGHLDGDRPMEAPPPDPPSPRYLAGSC